MLPGLLLCPLPPKSGYMHLDELLPCQLCSNSVVHTVTIQPRGMASTRLHASLDTHFRCRGTTSGRWSGCRTGCYLLLNFREYRLPDSRIIIPCTSRQLPRIINFSIRNTILNRRSRMSEWAIHSILKHLTLFIPPSYWKTLYSRPDCRWIWSHCFILPLLVRLLWARWSPSGSTFDLD